MSFPTNIYEIIFYMKIRIIITLLSLFVVSHELVFGQVYWKIDDYQNWNHSNFRSNKIFNQPFSTTNTDYLLLDAAQLMLLVIPLRIEESLQE